MLLMNTFGWAGGRIVVFVCLCGLHTGIVRFVGLSRLAVVCVYMYVTIYACFCVLVCVYLAQKQLIKSYCCCWQIAANPNTATELPKCLLMHACCCSCSAVAVSLAQLALIVLQCHLCCRLVVVVAESRKMHAKRSNCNKKCKHILLFYWLPR